MDNVPEIKEEKKRAFTSFMLRNRSKIYYNRDGEKPNLFQGQSPAKKLIIIDPSADNRDYEKAIEQMKSMGLLPVMVSLPFRQQQQALSESWYCYTHTHTFRKVITFGGLLSIISDNY